MVGLYPGAIYPGLYDWLLEVPVEPGLPPGTCLTSEVKSRCEVTAEVCSEVKVTDGGIGVTYPVIPSPEVPVLPMSCGIHVRYTVICETLECRSLVTSEYVISRQMEEDVTEPPSVTAEVRVTYLSRSAIGCTETGVTSSVEVRTKVVADLAFCCHGSKS